MEQYFEVALRFWNEFTTWSPSSTVLYSILLMSFFSAVVMTQVASAAPLFVGPISFIILTLAGMVSNFAMRGQAMMGTTEIQKALIFTAASHLVAGLILLLIFRANNK